LDFLTKGDMMAVGLKQRIQNAGSIKDVDALLVEGKSFTNASVGTRKAWVRVAEARKKAIRDEKQAKKDKKNKTETPKS